MVVSHRIAHISSRLKIPLTIWLGWWFSAFLFAAETQPSIAIDWLGGVSPALKQGVSWGVPWPKGAFAPHQKWVLTNADGRQLPLQSWPLAYWPDGSLKWTGFATVTAPQAGGPFKLETGQSSGTKPAAVSTTI
jgi:hypothetical protein